MDFRDFLEAGTQGEGPNASGGRGGANSMKPGMPQQGGVNPEPGKKDILGGPFGGGGPKKGKGEVPPASSLSPRFRMPWKQADPSKLSPAGYGQPPGPPQTTPPSEFVSRYMNWQPPSNAKKGAGWPVKTEKSGKGLF